MMMKAAAVALVALAAAALIEPRVAFADGARILVIGDSQISFGSGPVLEDFFNNLPLRCADAGLERVEAQRLQGATAGLIGVRATGLHMWLSHSAEGKKMLCEKDPTGLVNASVWGTARHKAQWIQIGETPGFGYCRRGTSVLEALIGSEAEPPDLLVLHFMGLSAWRWSKIDNVRTDFEHLADQLPPDMGCVVFTTAPGYTQKINGPRLAAQRHLDTVLGDGKGRCRYVPGLTTETVALIQGRPERFYRTPAGRVKDAFHPNEGAARAFLESRRRPLCRAIAAALPATRHTQRAGAIATVPDDVEIVRP